MKKFFAALLVLFVDFQSNVALATTISTPLNTVAIAVRSAIEFYAEKNGGAIPRNWTDFDGILNLDWAEANLKRPIETCFTIVSDRNPSLQSDEGDRILVVLMSAK